MKNIPERIHEAGSLHRDGVQQVVPEDKQQTGGQDNPGWEEYQHGEQQHTDANRPDHLQDQKAVRRVEGPPKVDDDQFHKHQPQTAGEQV